MTGGRGTYRDYVRMLLEPDVTTLKETNTSAAITYRLTALGVSPLPNWRRRRTCCAKQAVHTGAYLIISDSALGTSILIGTYADELQARTRHHVLLTKRRASADELPFNGGHDSIVVLLETVYTQQAISQLGSAPIWIIDYANLGVCVFA